MTDMNEAAPEHIDIVEKLSVGDMLSELYQLAISSDRGKLSLSRFFENITEQFLQSNASLKKTKEYLSNHTQDIQAAQSLIRGLRPGREREERAADFLLGVLNELGVPLNESDTTALRTAVALDTRNATIPGSANTEINQFRRTYGI